MTLSPRRLFGACVALLMAGAVGFWMAPQQAPQQVPLRPRLGGGIINPGTSTSAQVPYNAVIDGGCDSTGATDTTTKLSSAITAAIAANKPLYLPAGTYLVSKATGNVFSISTNNFQIFGDGVGQSVVKFAANTTLTGATTIFNLTGQSQSVHDLSITAGSGLNGALVLAGNTIVAPGTNYNQGDTLTLVGGANTSQAQVTVNVVGGVNGPVSSIATLVTGGSYTFAGVTGNVNAAYTVTGGNGSGAKLQLGGTSSPSLTALTVNQGGARAHLYNLDISQMWGLQTSGGAGITTYQPPQQNDPTFGSGGSTTFADNVTAGAFTVTPVSMAGIYPGRTLRVSGNGTPETIQVTSVTATTMTATFNNAHNTGTLNGWALGHQYNLIENCVIHDCYQASATVMNSGENIYRNIRCVNIGSGGNQHALYDQQGGHNVFDSCYVEGCAGYSYHVHIAAGSIADASGNRFVHCYSVNPGTQHFYCDSTNGDGTDDPTVPSGQPLNRYVSVIGCNFKCTTGAVTPFTGVGVSAQLPAVFQSCVFEDTCSNGNNTWLSLASNSSSVKSVASGCIFRKLASTANTETGVSVGNNAVVTNCQFVGIDKPVAISGTTGNSQVIGCQFDGCASGQQCINIAASGMNNVVVANCVAAVGNSNTTGFISVGTTGITGLQVHGNNVTLASGAHFLLLAANKPTGQIHDNVWSGSTGGVKYTDSLAGLDFYQNNGPFNFNNTVTNALALDSRAGHMLMITPGASTLTGGLAVTVAGTANSATTDTQFLGVAPCNKDSTNGAFFICGWAPGQVVQMTTDGAFTAGNMGILSTTTGGQIHDTGSTAIPAAGKSYVQFLTTGGGAGTATVLVLRTLQ